MRLFSIICSRRASLAAPARAAATLRLARTRLYLHSQCSERPFRTVQTTLSSSYAAQNWPYTTDCVPEELARLGIIAAAKFRYAERSESSQGSWPAMDPALDGPESSPETTPLQPKRSTSKRPTSPPPTGRPAAAPASGVERQATVSSPDRRRQAKGAPVERAAGNGGGANDKPRGWTWGSDRTSLEILERSFNLFDKDGDGAISSSELRSVLSNLGEDVDDDMVAAMIDMGDVGNTGEVNYDDFLSLMTGKDLPPKSKAKKKRLDVRFLFKKIDADGSGFLDKDEVLELCQQLGGGVKKRHIEDIMRQMKPHNAQSHSEALGGSETEDGVSFEMFRSWWEDRNRKLNDLLVLPEGMIFSIREDAKVRKLLPSANGAEAMWHRLAVL